MKCLVPGLTLPPTFFVSPDTSVPQFPQLHDEECGYADRMRPFIWSTQESVWHVLGCGFAQFTLDEKSEGQEVGGTVAVSHGLPAAALGAAPVPGKLAFLQKQHQFSVVSQVRTTSMYMGYLLCARSYAKNLIYNILL